MSLAERYDRLPTAAKLFLILSAVMLPIGIALTWIANNGINQAKQALRGRADDQGRLVAKGVDALLARNALALRVAANGALSGGPQGACERTQRSLSIAPAVAQRFAIDRIDGTPICAVGSRLDSTRLPLVAPGAIRVLVDHQARVVVIRIGVIGGMATDVIPLEEVAAVARESSDRVASLALRNQEGPVIPVIAPPGGSRLQHSEWPLGGGQMVARVGTVEVRLPTPDRLVLLLPVVMWIAAAVISWWLVTRLLIRPLRRLERAVGNYQPGEGEFDLPDRLGPSTEIQQLRLSFARAIERIEVSEREMAEALEGQRRLVREVHHRVKNNLQVVASLLNIHGRSASSAEARDAYVAIGRRVGALAVVHRNHFAELEENRGISLRPLLSELATELRASAPEHARGFLIDLDVEHAHTTQDVAVAVAFLVTEIVEYSMLHAPDEPVEIELRRTSELTGRLSLTSQVLNPDEQQEEKVQFERIVTGLAKQLRSPLDRKLGRYAVEFPIFPPKN